MRAFETLLDVLVVVVLLALTILWLIEGRTELAMLAAVAMVNRIRIVELEGFVGNHHH